MNCYKTMQQMKKTPQFIPLIVVDTNALAIIVFKLWGLLLGWLLVLML